MFIQFLSQIKLTDNWTQLSILPVVYVSMRKQSHTKQTLATPLVVTWPVEAAPNYS